jgi:tRNA pseudouridine38-40 synthase
MNRRVALKLEYDGGGFSGWQRQDGSITVQQVLEEACAKLTHNTPVLCTAAGRTDAGVHAEAMVASCDLPEEHSAFTIRNALNFHTKPHPLCVLEVAEVDADWNARFSAKSRAYRYAISTRRARLVLEEGRAWHVGRPLDAAAMHEAAQSLLGRHDFTSFRAASCQANSALRTLDRLDVMQYGERVEIFAEARSFLHHQVRNMVGTLKLVGEGRMPAHRVAQILAAKNRAKAGPTAPPEGLYFTAVRYEPDPFTLR